MVTRRGTRTIDLRLRVWIVLLGLLSARATSEAATGLQLQLIASGIPYLVDIQRADAGGRLFLVSQTGQIRILQSGTVSSTLFLDLSSIVQFTGEQGLLGLAFHPQYAANGYFFVNYTEQGGANNVVARYQVSTGDPNVADPSSATVVLKVPQPFGNHNGGQIAFGPDGYLYIAKGDGGSAGDPLNSGQRLDTLLGKVLRIDVNAGSPYGIPPDNPFIGNPGALPEIWALGLRNPWRFSFDRETGDMFIADVGQGLWEEVNHQPAASGGGRNYGWRVMEGKHCYAPANGCDPVGRVLPIVEYSHSFGCSITGGFRYRGNALPEFRGTYFFSDICSGGLFGAAQQSNGEWRITQFLDSPYSISTFGEDAAGEIYAAHYSSNGAIYRVEASPLPAIRLTLHRSGSGRAGTSNSKLDCGDVCAVDVAAGTLFDLTATADAGSSFFVWTGDADCTDGSVTMTADRTCTAIFGAAFTDPTLTPGETVVRAIHVTELRSRIDELRIAQGLPAFAWTTTPLTPGVIVSSVHVDELRTGLRQAYEASGRALVLATDSGALDGLLIKAAHFRELREAVAVLEAGS